MNIEQISQEFEGSFNADLSQFRNEALESYRQIFFDLFKFQDWLIREHDYQPNKESMQDFVEKTFGSEANKLIYKLIDNAPFNPPQEGLICESCGKPIHFRVVTIHKAIPIDEFIRCAEQDDIASLVSAPQTFIEPICECGKVEVAPEQLEAALGSVKFPTPKKVEVRYEGN